MSQSPEQQFLQEVRKEIRRQIEDGPPSRPPSDLDLALEENHTPRRGGPFIPVDVDVDTGRLVFINGRWVHDLVATFKQADIERLRQGYGCLICWEEFPSPFPERCPICQYRSRERQTHDFGKVFDGDRWVGSRLDEREETERLREWKQDEMARRGLRSRGVWIPGGV